MTFLHREALLHHGGNRDDSAPFPLSSRPDQTIFRILQQHAAAPGEKGDFIGSRFDLQFADLPEEFVSLHKERYSFAFLIHDELFPPCRLRRKTS